jgi:hypothetical protein
MATFKDPVRCFAPLEVIERLLEIRADSGYLQAVYLHNSIELADCLDAHGFDIYAFSTENSEINYGDYTAPIVPGGDNVHCSITTH